MRSKNNRSYIKLIVSMLLIISVIYSASKFYYHQRTSELREVVSEVVNTVADNNSLEKSKKTEYADKLTKLGYTNIKIDSPEMPVPFKSIITINVQVDPPFLAVMKWAWKNETTQRYTILARNATY